MLRLKYIASSGRGCLKVVTSSAWWPNWLTAVSVQQRKSESLRYRDISIENAYRLDLLVEDELILEIKSRDDLLPSTPPNC